MSDLMVEFKDDIALAILPERLTMGTSQDVKQRLLMIANSGHITLDFGACQFVDSSGLAALVALYKACVNKDTLIIIANVNAHILSLLELTRLTELFVIVDSVYSATQYHRTKMDNL